MRGRALGALALAALGTLLTGVVALADQPSFTFSANADARPLELTGLYPRLSNVPLVDARYPHAQSDISSPDQATARASTLDPGALVETGPSVAQQAGIPLPPLPEYPFLAKAGPGQPAASGDAAGKQVGPVWVGAGHYQAQAQSGSAQAEARGAGISLSGLAGAVQIAGGSAVSSTTAGGGQVTASVQQSLQDVTLLGALKIGQIQSQTTATASPGAQGQVDGHTTLSGVSILGQAATVDSGGIHLAGQSVPLPKLPLPSPPAVPAVSPPPVSLPGLPVSVPGPGGSTPAPSAGDGDGESPAQAWLDSLQALGITVRLAPETRSQDPGQATYQGSALEVGQRLSDGTTATLRLGGLSVEANAQPLQPIGPGLLLQSGHGGLGSGLSTLSSGHGGGQGGPPGGAGGKSKGWLSTPVWLPLAPRGLLLGLLAPFDLALLVAIALLLRRPRTRPPGPTLTGL